MTLKCLTEIAGLQLGNDHSDKFVLLYDMVMASVPNMIPPNTSEFAELLRRCL